MLKTNIVNFIVCIAIALVATFGSCAFFTPSIPTLPTPPQPVQVINTGIVSIESFFSRQANQDPAPVLASLYGQTKVSLDIAIYSLTHPVIVKAVTDAKKRGVVVRVITDKTQAAGKSQQVALDTLLLNNILCKQDNHSGLMHLKMSIIDSSTVTIGSYNYSMGASEDNDEVLLVIRNDSNLVNKCILEFNRMWNSPKFIDATRSY